MHKALLAAVCAATLATSAASAASTAELKAQIIAIAYGGQTDDNFAEVQAQLTPLIAQLVASVPARTEQQKLPQVVGTWQQIWTNAQATLTEQLPPPYGTVDRGNAYQFISPSGYYYNFERLNRPGPDWTLLLRGAYTAGADALSVKFTAYTYLPEFPINGANLTALILRAEAGDNGRPVPGPAQRVVGQTGTFTDTYVDDTLRIVTSGQGLFILLRADRI